MLYRLRQLLCGLQGHDSLRQFERDRMYLKCISCGHESHGWDLARGSGARRERLRASIQRHHLVGLRRTA